MIHCGESPGFTDEAKALLQQDPKLFRQSYGDYFVKAVQLGGECGFLLSQSSSTSMKSEVPFSPLLYSIACPLTDHPVALGNSSCQGPLL